MTLNLNLNLNLTMTLPEPKPNPYPNTDPDTDSDRNANSDPTVSLTLNLTMDLTLTLTPTLSLTLTLTPKTTNPNQHPKTFLTLTLTLTWSKPSSVPLAGTTAAHRPPRGLGEALWGPLDRQCIEWSVSLEQLGDRQLRELCWGRKFSKEPPGSGDLTSLTTEPNGIGTHVSRHPFTEKTRLPSSFLGTS